MKYEANQNKYGFYQVAPLPSSKELGDFYAKKYFQRNKVGGTYSHTYSEAELENTFNVSKVAEHIWNRFRSYKGTFLDVGCGEGFFLKYFASKAWKVLGVDFSSYGVEIHNPEMKENLIQGDLFQCLINFTKDQKQFDYLNCKNVFEHVTDPEQLLKYLNLLMHTESLLRIEVPNDFSVYQMFLKNEGLIDRDYWFVPPEHLNYFSVESLKKFLNENGFNVLFAHGDFPIEIFLSNSNSNYISNKEVGKFAHESRIRVNNFLIRQGGLEKYINYMKVGLEVGLSRQLVVYAEKSAK